MLFKLLQLCQKRIFLAGIFLFSVLLSNSQTTKKKINEIIKEWASPTKFQTMLFSVQLKILQHQLR